MRREKMKQNKQSQTIHEAYRVAQKGQKTKANLDATRDNETKRSEAN